jgi:hypothetical protein
MSPLTNPYTPAPVPFKANETAIYRYPLTGEVAGKGLFSAARLVINTNNLQHAAQLRFSLTLDGNVLFYGMPGWFMSSKPQEKGDITVSVLHPNDPSDGNCSIVIDMKLPFRIRFHRQIRVNLTGPEDCLVNVCSGGWYFSAYRRPEDPRPETKPVIRLCKVPMIAS